MCMALMAGQCEYWMDPSNVGCRSLDGALCESGETTVPCNAGSVCRSTIDPGRCFPAETTCYEPGCDCV